MEPPGDGTPSGHQRDISGTRTSVPSIGVWLGKLKNKLKQKFHGAVNSKGDNKLNLNNSGNRVMYYLLLFSIKNLKAFITD